MVTIEPRTNAPEIVIGTGLTIIRHGEAWCNFEQFVGGPKSCRGLTLRGQRQAGALRDRLLVTKEIEGASALWTSTLPRAIETAQIGVEELLGLELHQSTELTERDAGEADGLFWHEIPIKYGRSSIPGENPDLPLSPGGESWITFIDRASAELNRLAIANPGRLTVVVAHGGIIDASLIRFLALPDHGAQVRLHAEHTSITEWRFTGKRWRLVRYNDFAHLLDPVHLGELRSPSPQWVHTE
jgi:probable phosphoglycerate mutase